MPSHRALVSLSCSKRHSEFYSYKLLKIDQIHPNKNWKFTGKFCWTFISIIFMFIGNYISCLSSLQKVGGGGCLLSVCMSHIPSITLPSPSFLCWILGSLESHVYEYVCFATEICFSSTSFPSCLKAVCLTENSKQSCFRCQWGLLSLYWDLFRYSTELNRCNSVLTFCAGLSSWGILDIRYLHSWLSDFLRSDRFVSCCNSFIRLFWFLLMKFSVTHSLKLINCRRINLFHFTVPNSSSPKCFWAIFTVLTNLPNTR